jgi:hypothetical protein
LAVAGLAGWFSFMSWEHASQVAGVVSALVGVFALGAAVWAALLVGGGGSVRVMGTGKAKAIGPGAKVNTGVMTSGGSSGDVHVENTGDGEAENGGTVNTGFQA